MSIGVNGRGLLHRTRAAGRAVIGAGGVRPAVAPGAEQPWLLCRAVIGVLNSQHPAKRIIEGRRARRSVAIDILRAGGIDPASARADLERLALPPGVILIVVDRHHYCVIARRGTRGTRLDGTPLCI